MAQEWRYKSHLLRTGWSSATIRKCLLGNQLKKSTTYSVQTHSWSANMIAIIGRAAQLVRVCTLQVWHSYGVPRSALECPRSGAQSVRR